MANMFDYLDWYGDFGFSVVPFDEVDNLIFCQLSYLDLGGIVEPLPATGALADGGAVSVTQAASRFEELHPSSNPSDLGPLISPDTNRLLARMAAGRRLADARLFGYEATLDLARHEQFGAVCAALADGSTYVAFRGTDDELVGWLEDCEISYRVIPSQEHALRYLARVAELTTGPLRVGGHSKGGNLAAYAVSRAPRQVRDRVVEVWCNDSPGFEDRVTPLETFRPIVPLVHLYTPEYSVVGSLFRHLVEPVVIRSSGGGVMEHSAVNWQVMRGSFVRGEGTQNGSAGVREAFAKLMASRDLPGRKKLLDSLYEALGEQGISSMDDMLSRGLAGLNATMASLRSLDEDDRQTMNTFLGGILGATVAGAVSDAVTPVAQRVGEGLRDAAAGAMKAIAEQATSRTRQALDPEPDGKKDAPKTGAPAQDGRRARAPR